VTRQRPQFHRGQLPALASLAALLGGCVSTVAPPITAALQSHSGASPQTLKSGRELFVYRCTSCHTIDPVASHPISYWRDSVRQMAARSKLTAAEEAAIVAYLGAARETPAG
jgi:hypothetical protein